MTVELAFIGAGGIADWQHFDSVDANEDAEVVAICDVDEATARAAGDRFDAPTFADHRDLFAAVDDGLAVDAVFVCLPPFAHEGQEVAAAERGLDLFVEKPLALSIETARSVQDAVEANDVLAQVGYNWRYARGVERARELLEGRTVGYLDGYWWGGVAGGPDHWWRRADRSGGQVVEQATHVYDAIRYLAGDVERVIAAGSHCLEELVDFPDATSATLTHASGAVSHVSNSCAAEAGKTGVEVIADGATLTVTQDGVEGTVDGEPVREEFDHNPYRAEFDAFVDAVRSGGGDVRSTYADATRTLAVTLAVTEAVETGRPVEPDAATAGEAITDGTADDGTATDGTEAPGDAP